MGFFYRPYSLLSLRSYHLESDVVPDRKPSDAGGGLLDADWIWSKRLDCRASAYW